MLGGSPQSVTALQPQPGVTTLALLVAGWITRLPTGASHKV